MAGTKRASPDSGASTRASKIAKTDNSQTPPKAKKGPKRGVKPAIPAATFKATALPVHVNLTHTPPTIADPKTEAVSAVTADPGFIGNLTLLPSSFSTGSYGWKGSKRITVELLNSESDTKEKVQVMLTINATVLGSKQAKSGEERDEDEPRDDEADKEEEEEAAADDA
ncbi:hypothetical protein D9615_001958 [Tricholomella constricta]|uniref:Uncharacterized protein n=1 Tax=Tricholomella constricta TaxID=117010 RepID=A0A8H5HP40_9AGAR|nr:hypothetical protein D9615_001958 [Tricholomella constricta]